MRSLLEWISEERVGEASLFCKQWVEICLEVVVLGLQVGEADEHWLQDGLVRLPEHALLEQQLVDEILPPHLATSIHMSES